MNDINCWEEKFELCIYAERLLAKLELSNQKVPTTNKVNIKEIKKAIYYAKKYHGEQRRLSGEPYYSHPLEVAYNVADYRFREDTLITSILHDTLEDTSLTKAKIKVLFNNNIAEQVYSLTRIKIDKKITAAETIDLLWLQKKKDLLLIKFFDRLHNLQTIKAKSPEKVYKIINETLRQFLSLGSYLKATVPNLFNADNNIFNLCYKQFPITKQHLLEPSLMQYCEDRFLLPSPISQNEKPLT